MLNENERLTHKRNSGMKGGYWSPNKKDELIERLAMYENTGFRPDEIKAVVSDEEFEKYLEEFQVQVEGWKKDGFGYVSRLCQITELIQLIPDKSISFTVGQLKQLFDLAK